MKRGFKLLIALLLLGAVILSPISASAAQELKIKINGEIVSAEKPPILDKGRTLVPINGVLKKLNAKVSVDEKQNKVFIEDNYTTVELTVGDQNALVHKKFDFSGIPLKVTLDVPAKRINGTVYVPLRFVAESLGAIVGWDGENYMVIIDTEGMITPVETPAEYFIIHEADIGDEELEAWYNANYKVEGIHSYTTEKDTFVLISAGVKPTGGYSIDITSATIVRPGSLYVTANINKPEPGSIVTMALTNPNLLLKFENQVFEIVDGLIEE